MTTKPSVNLDALLGDAGSVTLDGVEVPVLPIDGAGYHTLSSFGDGDPATNLLALYEIAKRCLRSLTSERVMQMTAAQVGAVISVAGGHVEAVESIVPNSSRSTEKRGRRSKVSSPATPSVT